jgi:glycerol uptake facilitator-like aquaporin
MKKAIAAEQIATFLLLFAGSMCCLGVEDTNAIAISPWSEPVVSGAEGQSGSSAVR